MPLTASRPHAGSPADGQLYIYKSGDHAGLRMPVVVVEGFDLDAVGVLASIAGPLAQNRISLYVISTYDTDYVLIHAKDIDKAVSCLDNFGHTFVDLKDKA